MCNLGYRMTVSGECTSDTIDPKPDINPPTPTPKFAFIIKALMSFWILFV